MSGSAMPQHHVRDTAWGILDFDDHAGFVLVQQRWHYNWLLWPGVLSAWTLHEKQRFHATVDREIWDAWSYKIKLSVMGGSPIAQRLHGHDIRMNFDVKWTLSPPWDWTVNAYKMPPGTAPRSLHVSQVIASNKTIELDTSDLQPRGAANQANAATANFRTPPHEFGHSIISGNATANPDEYLNSSPNLGDTSSIMNIGRDLRKRHLTAVIAELDKMIPELTFSIVAPAL